jgi:hypothetical protein
MPYCTNCGEQYSRPQKYCRRCGLNVSPAPGSFASDSTDASTRSLGYERSSAHLRRKRRDARESSDSLQMYMGCIAVIAFIHGLSLYMGPGLGKLLDMNSPLLWVLLAGIVAGAAFKFIFDLRYGYSPGRSLFEIILFGLLTYGLLFGCLWYLHDNVFKPGKAFFDLTSILPATPTPHPITHPTP